MTKNRRLYCSLRISLFFVCQCCFLSSAWADVAESIPALSLQNRITDIYRNNEQAVVKIVASFNSDEPSPHHILLVGTGFFISKSGHILTNTNIVFGASSIWIEKNGIAYICEAMGHDPLTNISIIKARTIPNDFSYLHFSESSELPAIGSFLVSINCEMGMAPSPAFGLTTGWNTEYVERPLPTVYLRSDIAYDGGEGGAPVFDINGALVGIVVAALPEIRSSLILPSRAVQRVRDDILFSGEARYAFFGFQTRQQSNPERGIWVEVEGVATDSPAEQAGIRKGDILTQVGSYAIHNDEQLRMASFFVRPEVFVTLVVERDGQLQELDLKPTVREVPISSMPSITAQ